MSIVVTGAGGQLGAAILRAAAAQAVQVHGLDRAALDIADEASIERVLLGAKVVINTAAFTNVDGAEGDILGAWRGNCTGPALLADWCARNDAALVHVSTDYVFDGVKAKPYGERDAINPLGAYGASKAEGEAAVAETLDRHMIVRSSWLFSAWPGNFVATMLRVARDRDEIRVVNDRYGSPTSADDLAAALLTLAKAAGDPKNRKWGLFHYGGAPATTWYGFAEEIFRHHPKPPRLVPVSGAEWPAPAPRPANSALECTRIKRDFGIAQPDWRKAVANAVPKLLEQMT